MRLPCAQCGGDIRLQETNGFVRCPFCGATLVLDSAGVRPHFLYRPRLGPPQVLPLLRRWSDAAGAPAPRLAGPPRLSLYPFWRYATLGRARLVPAWSTLEARWREVRAPEAEQVLFEPDALPEARVIEPDVGELAARGRAGSEEPGVLVHLPFLEAAVEVGGQRAVAAIDACSGRVDVEVGGGVGGVRQSALVPALGCATMAGCAALLPTAWGAAAGVALLALAWYLVLAGGRAKTAGG